MNAQVNDVRFTKMLNEFENAVIQRAGYSE